VAAGLGLLAGCAEADTIDRQEEQSRARMCVSLLERRLATATIDPEAADRLSPRLQAEVEGYRDDPDAFYDRLAAGLEDAEDSSSDGGGRRSNLREILDLCSDALR
jgi:hypothetical protein